MRALLVALALVLAAPAAALAKKTDDLTFKSTGAAAAPGAVVGTGEAGTYEDIPFKIAADDADGTVTVDVTWANPADDWDIYVYRKNSTGGLQTVGSDTGAPPASEAKALIQAQSTPIDPGDYVVRVQNYSATSPDFSGTIKFTDYAVPNAKPTAKLNAPKTATAGKQVKLDASGSKDSDGQIVNYAWDLNGDGSFETDGGGSSILKRAFGAGVRHVTVRVTDDKGKRGYATRTIRVAKRH
jgi:hypothetical protein